MRNSILLTGATGFLGKVVLQELLRNRESLGVHLIFLLIRATSQNASKVRMEREIFQSECLEGLTETGEECVRPIWGDLHKPNLGISEDALTVMSKNVTQVIHCAATIGFNSTILDSVKTNVDGTLEVFRLTKHFSHRPFFTFVSTAYVHRVLPQKKFEEKPIILPREAREIYEDIHLKRTSERTLLKETCQANAYTLSKCLAEHLLIQEAEPGRLQIIRPSIISACLERPFPGWIDSSAGFAGFVAMLGTGQLRAVPADPKVALNVVPCDVVAQNIVHTSNEGNQDRPMIRQCVASHDSSCSIDSCRRRITSYFFENQITDPPDIRYVGPKGLLFHIADLALHTIPLLYNALIQYIFGDPAKAKQIKTLFKKIQQTNANFSYFTHNDYDFSTSLPTIEFASESYLTLVCSGVRDHILKRRRLRRKVKRSENESKVAPPFPKSGL